MHSGELLNNSFILFAEKYSVVENVREHISAIQMVPDLRIKLIDPITEKWDGRDLSCASGIIIHYSVSPIWNSIWHPNNVAKIRHFSGIKIVFVQDEYRQVNRFQELCATMGIQYVFSSVNAKTWATHYPDLVRIGVQFEKTLPGYVSNSLKDLCFTYPSMKEKYIGYRSRKVPFYLGKHGRQKVELDVSLRSLVGRSNWIIDSSVIEEKRLARTKWYDYLSKTRVSPTVEGGSSTWDFTGELEEKGRQAEIEGESFDEFYQRFLIRVDGKIDYKTSSPRIFESAAVGSVILAVDGDYDGLLQNNYNCLMIETLDHLEDALIQLEDESFCDFLAENARMSLIDEARNNFSTLQNRLSEIFWTDTLDPLRWKFASSLNLSLGLEKHPWIHEIDHIDSRHGTSALSLVKLLKRRSSRLLLPRIVYHILPNRTKSIVAFFLQSYLPKLLHWIKSYLD